MCESDNSLHPFVLLHKQNMKDKKWAIFVMLIVYINNSQLTLFLPNINSLLNNRALNWLFCSFCWAFCHYLSFNVSVVVMFFFFPRCPLFLALMLRWVTRSTFLRTTNCTALIRLETLIISNFICNLTPRWACVDSYGAQGCSNFWVDCRQAT